MVLFLKDFLDICRIQELKADFGESAKKWHVWRIMTFWCAGVHMIIEFLRVLSQICFLKTNVHNQSNDLSLSWFLRFFSEFITSAPTSRFGESKNLLQTTSRQ
jgi:hypothetical protein